MLMRQSSSLLTDAALHAFVGSQELKPGLVEVLPFLCDFADLLRHTLDTRINVVVDVDRKCLPWSIDRAALYVALMHLVLNARDAMPAGGRLTIRASADYHNGIKETSLDITDTGSGMPVSVLGMAETPFFNTKVGSRMSGMGLPAVGGFVAQSGGSMRISSVEGRGTTVRIVLPTAERDDDPNGT